MGKLLAQRQGDVIFILGVKIPEGAKKLDHKVIAEGEITGHKHEISEGKADLYEKDGVLYMRVESEEVIVDHPEHKEQIVKKGDIEIDFPQEYDYIAEESRRLQD